MIPYHFHFLGLILFNSYIQGFFSPQFCNVFHLQLAKFRYSSEMKVEFF
jgi:hypothetical protein